MLPQALETLLTQCRPLLEVLNEEGPQLAELTLEEGAAKVERILARDNKAVGGATDQVAKRADRLNLQRQKSHEVCRSLLKQWDQTGLLGWEYLTGSFKIISLQNN